MKQSDAGTAAPERVETTRREVNTQAPAEAAPAAPAAVRQQVSVLNKDLEAAANKFERLQTALARQEQLEQLLKQGRTHLEGMRSGLQQMIAQRDLLQTTLNEKVAAHQIELDRLHKEIDAAREHFAAAATERDGLVARLEEREREMLSREEEHRQHFARVTAERDRLATEIETREAAQKQYAAERSEERSAFERLLAEARSNQRDMVQELDEQSEQNKILREAAIRAQALARQIMNTHEPAPPEGGDRK